MKSTSVRGFTLLEVLIALLIFSFGMMGLAALQMYSVQTNQSAHLRSQATALAGMMMDSLRANRQNVRDYYANDYSSFTCSGTPATTPQSKHDLEFWRQQIACALPGGVAAVAPISANEVAVCIRWSDARWETSDGSASGTCTADAASFGASWDDSGPGAGTDGQFSVFVVATRF